MSPPMQIKLRIVHSFINKKTIIVKVLLHRRDFTQLDVGGVEVPLDLFPNYDELADL